MFKCRVCIEKDLRIKDLKDQIADLKNQLNPPPRVQHYELQQDMLLNGGNEEEIVMENPADALSEQIANDLIVREQDMIFSGNSDETER